MRVDESKRDWTETAVSAAVSAAAIPLLGAGLFRLPGVKQRGAVLRANFVACKSCRRERENWLGAFVLNRDRASHHPHWNELQDAGFTKFFDEWELGQAKVTPSPYAALWL